ncbi:site-specific integrase [Synechococcus sp. ROS8604]|uniref:site-specific integrase n=1 Tax=Synechococcus sp. ROS8604 TaxID=1442557 RepID=UPI0016496FA1|nr:site-specific integrase [Synechococcus sp. ROS8604]QNI87852.1 phage integrase family protein [Synechococcus sp. ROS8604]
MPKTTWITDVRNLLRREHGKGWLIEEQSGRIKLCFAPPGQRRQAVTTHLSWAPSSQTKLTALLSEVRKRMESLGLSLGDAYKLISHTPDSAPGQPDWEDIAKRYEQLRVVVSGDVTQDNYDSNERYRVNRVLKLLALPKKAPHDGASLFRAYAFQHLANVAPGGSGRKRNLLDVARFLTFAVKRCGAPQQWLPPIGEDADLFVGQRETASKATVPIKPEQLLSLLNSLAEKPQLRLAVALVGLYGLRPAELMMLSIDEGQLKVGNVKRNSKTARNPKPPRLVLPLDLKDLPGEGKRILDLYDSGLVKLPITITNAKGLKACGDTFRQYLDRHPYWQNLVASTPGLKPYGLRHGYAWRGASYYDKAVPMRDLAALMGHDLRTHTKHYGQWTTDEDVKESVLRAVGTLIEA